MLLVHAKHEAAKEWYMQLGFEESPTDPLHLRMLLKDVRVFLQRQGIGQPRSNGDGALAPEEEVDLRDVENLRERDRGVRRQDVAR